MTREAENDSVDPPARQGSWWSVLAVGVLAGVALRSPARSLVGGQNALPERQPATGEAPSGASQGSTNAHHADPDKAAAEPGRGREARHPTEIPVLGWKDIFWRVYADLDDHRILAVAAGVTFYALLALFPAIAAFVSLYGLFADPTTINKQLAAMAGFMPGGALDIIGDQVKRIASKPSGALGFALVFGLGVSLWSANAGMKAIFDALNIVYDEKEKRGFVALNALSLAFTVAAIAILMLAIGAVVVLPIVLNYVGLGGIGETLLALSRWPLLLLAVVGGLAVLYRFGPSRKKARWGWITWGSGFSAVAWLAASLGFSYYVGHFGSYNETYGSLGAAIGFMTWIWISTIIILLGAEINAEMEHQTAEDTTVSDGKPLGDRGATMADTVGAAKA